MAETDDNNKKENPVPEQKKEKREKREWWEIPARSALLIVLIVILLPGHWYRAAYIHTIGRLFPETVESRLKDFGAKAEKRLALKEIPLKLRIIVLKQEKKMELWGMDKSDKWTQIGDYPILTIPEGTGPKLRKDEMKTPEGVYKFSELNPNSEYYLALKLNYPTVEDKQIAKKEGRNPSDLESDFLFHGMGYSKYNAAVTDRTLEDLFYILSKVALDNAEVLIVPMDFRKERFPDATQPEWLLKRYQIMRDKMEEMREKKGTENAKKSDN